MARRYYRKNKNADLSQLFIAILVLFAIGSYFTTSYSKQLDFITIIGPILVIFVILFGLGLLWVLVKREQRRTRALEIADIDNMAGEQFEYYVGEVMKSRGYHVSYTKRSGDFGTDIVALKENRRYSVQLKRYNHPVGPPAIHQAVGSMVMYNTTYAMVVTNNKFTKEAKQLAEANKCELIDRTKLSDWILEFQKKK